jgi:glucose/arabinose dehydrogenase
MKSILAILCMASLCVGACGPLGALPGHRSVLGSASTSTPTTLADNPSAKISLPAPPPLDEPAPGPAFPNPGAFVWAKTISGLETPVDIQFPDDAPGRMFVVEKRGRIRIVERGKLLHAAFLDISDRVDSKGNEQGLLGLAFHPRFAENGLFFVNYTDYHKHDVIARFRISADPRRADPDSESVLLSVDDPFPNHNGGVLAFGPDGYMYAGLGDGGGANDVLGSGQNTNTLLGKILRVDVDHGTPYAIPTDNPFARAGGRAEIWAYGLRNPWRISFDGATGDLYIADVGQDMWEEVDFLVAGSAGGANLGWNYREGSHRFAGGLPASVHLTYPIAEYDHIQGNCSVTGGFVYRGQLPEWQGVYLYGDYCSGKIWGLRRARDAGSDTQWHSQLLFETGANITTFGQDPSGEIYYASRTGEIYRLQKSP